MELYNIKDDIREDQALAKNYPSKTKELAKLLVQRLKEENAQMPVIKATGKRVPYPDELVK